MLSNFLSKKYARMLAIVGSRSFKDYDLVCSEMNLLIAQEMPEIKCIISGGAKGADTLAEKYAKEHNIKIIMLKPEWSKHGKKAAILRNVDIVNASSYVLAFWDGKSPGTRHSINYAKRKNIPVKIVKYVNQ